MSPTIPVDPGNGEESNDMAAEAVVDLTNAQVILTGMAGAEAAAATSRTRRFDQLAEDSAAMWGIAMTTPTVMMGLGFRVSQQSGGYPASSGTGTGQ